MFLKKHPYDTESAAPRKRVSRRRVIGIALIVLVTVFTLIVTVVMRQRIEAAEESMKPYLRRALQNDLIVCAGLLIVAIGVAFDFMTRSRHLPVRILGFAAWGAGILITAEALFMSGDIVVQALRRDAAPDASCVVVLGTALGEDNAPPLELNARLDTGIAWWKDHRDAQLIVTGGGTASAGSSKRKYATVGYNPSNKRKSPVDAIASLLADRMVPVLKADAARAAGLSEEEIREMEEAEAEDESTAESEEEQKKTEEIKDVALAMIRKVGESDSTARALENLLAAEGIGADTSIVLVTNNYDMIQAVRLAEEAGFTGVTRLPAPAGFWEFGANILWEVWLRYDPAVQRAEDVV